MAGVFYGDPFRRLFWGPSSSAAAADWIETPSSHIIKVNVPGLAREDIKVQLEEGNVLHVSGDAKEEQPKDAVWHAAERRGGDFSRRFALPDNVKAEQIKGQVENGVLTVVIPKELVPPKLKPRSIPVSSKL